MKNSFASKPFMIIYFSLLNRYVIFAQSIVKEVLRSVEGLRVPMIKHKAPEIASSNFLVAPQDNNRARRYDPFHLQEIPANQLG
jgi:hypothetical protein